MGSIQHIYSPDKWKIVLEGKSKIIPDDYIYKTEIGWCDDELSFGEIYEFISKENYEKIINKDYSVKTYPYSEQKIIIIDKNNNIVPLIKGKKDNTEIIKTSQNQQEKILKKGDINDFIR